MVKMITGDKFLYQGKELEFIQEVDGFCYFICDADAPTNLFRLSSATQIKDLVRVA